MQPGVKGKENMQVYHPNFFRKDIFFSLTSTYELTMLFDSFLYYKGVWVIMYAVIKTGGKQYRVAKGDEVKVEQLQGEVGDEVAFDQVLLTSNGENVEVGKPFLENSKVVGRIARQGKDKKIVVFKYKRRKGYRRKKGHRQHFTLVRIEDIKE